MKFQNKIRMQMTMVGMGAALLMAGSTRAQQDMDPAFFDIHPGTPAVSKAEMQQTRRVIAPPPPPRQDHEPGD